MRFSRFSTAALAAFSFGASSANPIAIPEQDVAAKRGLVGGLLGGGGDSQQGGNGGTSGLGLNLLPEVTSKVEGILGHVVGGLVGGLTGGMYVLIPFPLPPTSFTRQHETDSATPQ